MDPGLTEAHELLADRYQLAGQWSKAAECLRAGLKAARAADVLYRCRGCGHISAQEQPRCFRCGRWHDFQAVTRGQLAVETAPARGPSPDGPTALVKRLWGHLIRQVTGPSSTHAP